MPLRYLPISLRRRLRQFLPLRGIDLVFDDFYSRGHSSVPADPLRAERILTFLLAEGLCHRRSIHHSYQASIKTLLRTHEETYLESLREEQVLERVVGVPLATEDIDLLLEVQRRMVGGTHLATRLVQKSGGIALHLGGGLHHAWHNHGHGFCILNDVAVAIASQRAKGFDSLILVIDLDLHHGDGTEGIFAKDPSVHTFSIHNHSWADTAAVASTNIALGDEVQDQTYLEALREHLPGVIRKVQPRLVYYLAGTDPAFDDDIGNWSISSDAMLRRDRFVLQALREEGDSSTPTVILLAGGYGNEAWRYSARFFGSVLSKGRIIEPPSTDETTLLRYRMIAKLVAPESLTGLAPENDFGLSEEDIYGSLTSNHRVTRFLNYYTQSGIELALERTGILGRLRALGFHQVNLDWDLGNSSGHTLRVFGNRSRTELLAELTARRDRQLIPGYELLHVEWLLLQNPRRTFDQERSPLPGQEHPGLGLLRDIEALLVLICDRLGLAGISFVASHFHMAATSVENLRFLLPADETLFLDLQGAVRDLPLGMASRAIEQGRVFDGKTEEAISWRPMTMIFPVTKELGSYFESEKYLDQKAVVGPRKTRFQLRPP